MWACMCWHLEESKKVIRPGQELTKHLSSSVSTLMCDKGMVAPGRVSLLRSRGCCEREMPCTVLLLLHLNGVWSTDPIHRLFSLGVLFHPSANHRALHACLVVSFWNFQWYETKLKRFSWQLWGLIFHHHGVFHHYIVHFYSKINYYRIHNQW